MILSSLSMIYLEKLIATPLIVFLVLPICSPNCVKEPKFSSDHFKALNNSDTLGDNGVMRRKDASCSRESYKREAIRNDSSGLDDNEDNGHYPYVVSVKWDNVVTICVGSVVSHWHVLTSAHCVIRKSSGEQREAHRISVRVGSKYRSKGGFMLKVRRWFAPRNFVRKTKANDVAVLELAEFLEFSDGVNLIPLISVADEPSLSYVDGMDEPCFMFGWAKRSRKNYKTSNGVLRIRDSDMAFGESFEIEPVDVFSSKFCYELARRNGLSFNSKTEGCCKAILLQGHCKTGAGGPLVCNYKQFGIISAENGCDRDTGAIIFSRVDAYFDFITDAMNRKDLEIKRNEELTKMSKQPSLLAFKNIYIILILNLMPIIY